MVTLRQLRYLEALADTLFYADAIPFHLFTNEFIDESIGF